MLKSKELIRELLYFYFKVRADDLSNQLKLWFTPINYLVHRGKASCLGVYVPGEKAFKVKTWDGYTFLIRPRTEDLSLALLLGEHYELTKWFLPNAKGIVVDIGANIGGYTIRACQNSSLVVAIEPLFDVFKILEYNVKMNCPKGNVILVNKAISDRRGKATIKVPKLGRKTFSGRASILDKKSYHYEQTQAYVIETDTLDNIISSLSIRKIDFLKIDIEGAEAVAFRGMKRTLKNTRYLMIEIRPENKWLINELQKMGSKLIDRKGMNYFFVKVEK